MSVILHQISFEFDRDITTDHVRICVNGETQTAVTACANKFTVSLNVQYGFHMLSLALCQPDTTAIEILDLYVDGDSVREFLYLSWVQDRSDHYQPRTVLQNDAQTWMMPLIVPLSAFYASTLQQLRNGLMGQDLSEHVNFYFPEKINLPESFPVVVKDFFSTDLNFHVNHRNRDYYHDHARPWHKITVDYDHDALLNEVLKNLDSIETLEVVPGQTAANQKYYPQSQSIWRRYDLVARDPKDAAWQTRSNIAREQWPKLWHVLDNLEVDDISLVYLGELGPGGFIFPHIDSHYQDRYSGAALNVLYLPLRCDQGTFFKMANVGLVPLDQSVMINNKNFPHCIVNTGSVTRFTISVFCRGPVSDQLC